MSRDPLNIAARRREATLSSLLSLSMGDPPAPAAPPAPAPPKAAAPPPAEAPSPAGPAPAQPEGGARSADTTIRVDVSLLDELLNLVGELVIARNRMGRALQGPPAGQLTAFKRIDQLTSDLQARATKTRMRPISAAWASLPRTLRDLCAETGKEVRLELSGQETELDRSLLEAGVPLFDAGVMSLHEYLLALAASDYHSCNTRGKSLQHRLAHLQCHKCFWASEFIARIVHAREALGLPGTDDTFLDAPPRPAPRG
jgi:hypothetical protein